MNAKELKEVLRLHECWLINDPEGKRAYLEGANLRSANLRSANLEGAYLEGANLRSADLRSADLQKIKISWTSHALISEILWRAADTESRQMLSAYIGRKTDWCWDEWAKYQHPERKWALSVLHKYVIDGDNAPEIVKEAK